ncbi:hypothetical protein H696_06013 [Fonticula alba]|uniref:Uncharacterized protein n=1 Tax=Fonticula alba TaxID=691883 RepID=A0A058Z0S3_FONAL|nr:hypothetical protein H696_06013 [Fonticula alba]KCV67493.1 hypothetical protein H696_06013 [Fonticula alba]|eukprot:XP_009498054.1 hypothetical protein H696_06013 [Fonticula alba]
MSGLPHLLASQPPVSSSLLGARDGGTPLPAGQPAPAEALARAEHLIWGYPTSLTALSDNARAVSYPSGHALPHAQLFWPPGLALYTCIPRDGVLPGIGLPFVPSR